MEVLLLRPVWSAWASPCLRSTSRQRRRVRVRPVDQVRPRPKNQTGKSSNITTSPDFTARRHQPARNSNRCCQYLTSTSSCKLRGINSSLGADSVTKPFGKQVVIRLFETLKAVDDLINLQTKLADLKQLAGNSDTRTVTSALDPKQHAKLLNV